MARRGHRPDLGKMSISFASLLAIIGVVVAVPPSLVVLVDMASRSHRSRDSGTGSLLPLHRRQLRHRSPHSFHQQWLSSQRPLPIRTQPVLPRDLSTPAGPADFPNHGGRSIHRSSSWPATTSTVIQKPPSTHRVDSPRRLRHNSAQAGVLSSSSNNHRLAQDPQSSTHIDTVTLTNDTTPIAPTGNTTAGHRPQVVAST